MNLPDELMEWRSAGAFTTLWGQRIFFRDTGAGDSGDALVILHGFPSCSYDYRQCLPMLGESRRVIVHDHLGFGLSDKPVAASYSLLEQADYAIGLWRELGLRRVHVLAHDYGTSVATEILARRERGLLPIELASLTLCNGGMLIDMAKLTLTQQILRRPLLGEMLVKFSSEAFFCRRMRNLLADPSSVHRREFEVLWAALLHNEGKKVFRRIACYPDERWRFYERWVGPLKRLDLPALVLWGLQDPISVGAMADRLAGYIPGSRLVALPDLAHYPMLEDASQWSGHVRTFLDEVG